MKKLLNILLFSISIVYSMFTYSEVTLNAKITGDEIVWSNARVSNDVISQQEWVDASKLSMLPVYEWTPAFVSTGTSKAKFTNMLTGESVTSNLLNSGIEFRTMSPNTVTVDPTGDCNNTSQGAGIFSIISSSSCKSGFNITYNNAQSPFSFYRIKVKLPDLLDTFKTSKVSNGKYYASFPYTVTYYYKYPTSEAITYNTYTDSMSIIIDYNRSFISSVSTVGDGSFDLTYNTDTHTVSGKTSYNVNVVGEINPGIKMTFSSNNKTDDFYLKHESADTKIGYSMKCVKCRDSLAIEKGVATNNGISFIDYIGSNLNFDFDFEFNDVSESDVEEGKYNDTVTVMFELDI